MTFSTPKGLIPFIEELRSLNTQCCDDHTNINNVSTILKRWVGRQDWLEEKYYHVDMEVGYSSWLIHEEKDHTLAVYIDAWYPGRGIVPHDHKTWGIVGSVIGVEKNFFWTRIDDGSKPGYAEIKRQDSVVLRPAGAIVSFLPDDIHSVVNESETLAISLHVYGKNLNYSGRHQYDPVKKTMKPFFIKFS